MSDPDDQESAPARKEYFIPRLETFRQLNGWSRAKLAQKAGVDRETIAKMEKRKGVQDYIAFRVFKAVTEHIPTQHSGSDNEITNSHRPLKKMVRLRSV